MNITGFVLSRFKMAETFNNLRIQALIASLFAKILGKNTQIKRPPRSFALRNYIGEQDILIKQITGSMGRQSDFDINFRPLKKHLRERWISVYSMFEAEEEPPIHVYKLGNDYYVEDGHHRVSVARTIGRLSIRARVWEVMPQTNSAERTFSPPLYWKRHPSVAKPATTRPWLVKGEVL